MKFPVQQGHRYRGNTVSAPSKTFTEDDAKKLANVVTSRGFSDVTAEVHDGGDAGWFIPSVAFLTFDGTWSGASGEADLGGIMPKGFEVEALRDVGPASPAPPFVPLPTFPPAFPEMPPFLDWSPSGFVGPASPPPGDWPGVPFRLPHTSAPPIDLGNVDTPGWVQGKPPAASPIAHAPIDLGNVDAPGWVQGKPQPTSPKDSGTLALLGVGLGAGILAVVFTRR